ncbi:MAG: DUF2190 family protein [Pirellulales bacterium]|nr:DUF2190 family protein [Pirellulales bacterium]
MSTAQFVQEGASIDYTPAADVADGQVVVQGDLVGVANRAIPAGAPGSLAVEGVFDFPKATDVAYSFGTILFWDPTAGIVTLTGGSNKQAGKVVRAAATTDPTVRVRLASQAKPGTLLYANTAASAAIANTAAETPFDKSATIPADSLKAGDVLRIRALVFVTSTSGSPAFTIRLKAGSTAIAVDTFIAGAIAPIMPIYVDATVVFRAVGVGGQYVAIGTMTSWPDGFFTAATALDRQGEKFFRYGSCFVNAVCEFLIIRNRKICVIACCCEAFDRSR